MKYRLHPVFTLASLFIAVSLTVAATEDNAPEPGSDEFPVYVMNRIDDQYRGAKSHGIMEMNVKTKHWARSITMESWSLGKRYSLVRILKPKKEKGMATLKANADLFTYLSKTGRTIKITSGMMGASWMGSHFTNDDLIRHTRLSEDYTIKLTFDGQVSGTDVYRFTLIPQPDAPVVWGKVEVTVRQRDLQPLSQLFFDEEGNKVRLLEFSQHTDVDGRIMPLQMVMNPLDSPEEYTMIRWDEIDFKVELNQDFFTIQKLRSM